MSVGAVLLADTVPSLFAKLLGPFLPFYIKFVLSLISFSLYRFIAWFTSVKYCDYFHVHSIRVFLICMLQCAGFILVALAQKDWMVLIGIICTSIGGGLGESSLLAYSSRFHR